MIWKSPESIAAVIPAGLPSGVHEIVLSSGERSIRLEAAFTAVVPVAPRLDAVEPSVLPLEGGMLRLSGVGLFLGTTVRVGDAAAEATWRNDETLEVRAPPSPAPGYVPVEVTTEVGRARHARLLFYGDRP